MQVSRTEEVPSTRGAPAASARTSAGKMVLLWLLPFSVIVPLLTGALLVELSRRGMFDADARVALHVGINILTIAAFALWTASRVDREDRERRRAVDALERSEARFRKLTETEVMGAFVWHVDGRILDANQTYLDVIGYSRDDLAAGRVDWRKLTPPEYQAEDEAAVEELRKRGRGAVVRKRFVRKDGSLVPVLAGGTTFDDDPDMGIGFLFDLSELERAERELAEREERFRLVSLATNDAVYDWDLQTGSMWWSDALLRQFGHRPECSADFAWWERTVHPEDRETVLESVRGAVESGTRFWSGEYRFQRGDGTWATVLDRGYFLFAEERPVRMLGALTDITERKRAEQLVRDANEALEQRVAERTAELAASNRELEAFAYSVSHDLRAPLRTIEGFSRILIEEHRDQLDPLAREHLDRVRNATTRMGQLIDDLLTLSRIARSEMRRQPADLAPIARSIVEDLRVRDPHRDVEVTIAPSLEAECDPKLLRIVLENLLGNAWKFTSRRERARIVVGRDTSDPHLPFFVRDDGAGFDMAYASRLFSPFQRLHSMTEFEGNGVGLATVQRIIRRHGGEVRADAQPGRGATFYFTLPRTDPAPAAAPEARATPDPQGTLA